MKEVGTYASPWDIYDIYQALQKPESPGICGGKLHMWQAFLTQRKVGGWDGGGGENNKRLGHLDNIRVVQVDHSQVFVCISVKDWMCIYMYYVCLAAS